MEEKYPFTRKIIVIIENVISKTVDITNKDNNDLFLVFNVIHIRYSVVKIM